MYCNPVFIILIKYHRVKETQQISRGKCIINQFIIVFNFIINSLSFRSFSKTTFSPSMYIYIHEDIRSIINMADKADNKHNQKSSDYVRGRHYLLILLSIIRAIIFYLWPIMSKVLSHINLRNEQWLQPKGLFIVGT